MYLRTLKSRILHRSVAGYLRLSKVAGRWAPSLLIVLALLAFWEGYVRVFEVQQWLLPAPSVIATTMGDRAGMLSKHTLVTLEEVLIGFGLALSGGVALASAIALSRTFERAIYPFVIASPTIPWLLVAPLLLVWFGPGLSTKIIVVALIAFFPIVVTMVDGLRSIDPDLIDLMRTMGANRWQLFTKVQLPWSMPSLFSGIKVAVAVSVIGAVVGEWVGSSEGLGYLMIRSKAQFLTERVFAAIFILAAMGIGLFLLVGLIERWSIPWRHGQRDARQSGRGFQI